MFLKFFWMNNSIEYWVLYWMNIFLMNILDFVLNWILNWTIFRPDSKKKWIFKTDRPGLQSEQLLCRLGTTAAMNSIRTCVLLAEKPGPWLTKPAQLNFYELWIITKKQLEQFAYEIHSYYAMYAIYLNITQYYDIALTINFQPDMN